MFNVLKIIAIQFSTPICFLVLTIKHTYLMRSSPALC